MAVGGGYNDESPADLFDEASGRWFELPHPMAELRAQSAVVSLPATALPTVALAPPATAAAGASSS